MGDDSSNASSNTDLHPNSDELKGNSEFPIKASPTKDEILLANQRMTGRKMNTTSGNNETVSGNAMFVNVHNSNETLKITQGDPTGSTPYHSFANKDQKGPTTDNSDKTSTTNVNTIPSNAKTEAS